MNQLLQSPPSHVHRPIGSLARSPDDFTEVREPIGRRSGWKKGIVTDVWVTGVILIAHGGFWIWAKKKGDQFGNSNFWGKYGFEAFSLATDYS
jgi:hypothetical protein